MIEKGIMLAGGKGTRLSPVTKSTNKQLLPIYDKPLFFYPLSILMLADIKKILIIVNKGQKKNFYNLIGNGKHLGINITYKEKKYQISMLSELHKRSKEKSVEILRKLQDAAIQNKNIFEVLMDATKVCSLGEITNALFEVGGQYRRNM